MAQSCLHIFQILHSRYKLVSPWKRWCCKQCFLIVELVQWQLKKVISFRKWKVKNHLELLFWPLLGGVFIWAFFSIIELCHLYFPYKDILSFFGPWTYLFSYMEPPSIFSEFVQKFINCFSESFVQNRSRHPDSSCNVTNVTQFSRKIFKNQSFNFCNHIWRILCE